ncbi:hypothetical protein IBG10_004694 [Salmonella enterica]|nr:hypothetical protein [Salmonella enterica]
MASNVLDADSIIKGVNNGNEQALHNVPMLIEKIDVGKSNDLKNAITHSLIISTSQTLDLLNIIDEDISKNGHSSLRDKFGTDSICAYVIDSNKYDRESFFKYYSTAKLKLEKAGIKGKPCLDLMTSSVEETIYEEKQGKMKWGIEKYVFD